MIQFAGGGHFKSGSKSMGDGTLAHESPRHEASAHGGDSAESMDARPWAHVDPQRIRTLVGQHFDFIWRVLRRLGVEVASCDDAAQQVFLVASKKWGEIVVQQERSFLFAIALRVAAEERRRRKRRPEVCSDDECVQVADPKPGADEMLDQSTARATLDEILEGLPFEFRTVFMLFEMEQMSTNEIAELLQIPKGTVASRLRRARELYQEAVSRFRARRARGGAP